MAASTTTMTINADTLIGETEELSVALDEALKNDPLYWATLEDVTRSPSAKRDVEAMGAVMARLRGEGER